MSCHAIMHCAYTIGIRYCMLLWSCQSGASMWSAHTHATQARTCQSQCALCLDQAGRVQDGLGRDDGIHGSRHSTCTHKKTHTHTRQDNKAPTSACELYARINVSLVPWWCHRRTLSQHAGLLTHYRTHLGYLRCLCRVSRAHQVCAWRRVG